METAKNLFHSGAEISFRETGKKTVEAQRPIPEASGTVIASGKNNTAGRESAGRYIGNFALGFVEDCLTIPEGLLSQREGREYFHALSSESLRKHRISKEKIDITKTKIKEFVLFAGAHF